MDTDKMGDIDAAIFEKLDEVNKFFIDLKIPYIIRLYNHQGKQTGTQSAIHPTDDHDKATGVLLSQCLAAVQKQMPEYKIVFAPIGYKIQLIPEEPGMGDNKGDNKE